MKKMLGMFILAQILSVGLFANHSVVSENKSTEFVQHFDNFDCHKKFTVIDIDKDRFYIVIETTYNGKKVTTKAEFKKPNSTLWALNEMFNINDKQYMSSVQVLEEIELKNNVNQRLMFDLINIYWY